MNHKAENNWFSNLPDTANLIIVTPDKDGFQVHAWSLPYREKSIEITGHIKHPVLSNYIPVKGKLHTYCIKDKKLHCIDFSSMPRNMMEEQLGYTYFPKLLIGQPMIPVSYKQGPNGTYTLFLEDGISRHLELEQRGYRIMAVAVAGGREFAMGFNPDILPRYAVWERTKGQGADSGCEYVRGKYYEQYEQAMKDCESRTSDAYIRYCNEPDEKQPARNCTEKER